MSKDKSKKAKTQPVTRVLMAIDRSGSMWEIADDVRGGFNQYIADLVRDTDHTYKVSVALFDTTVSWLCKDVEPADVPKLDEDNYQPHRGTALLDAIGGLVRVGVADDGDKVLVVVNTDGYENSSREWNLTGVQKLVAKRTAQGWGFVFLGAGPAVWLQGERLGFSSAGTAYSAGATRGTYHGMTVGTQSYAAGEATADEVAATTKKFSDEGDEEAKRGGK